MGKFIRVTKDNRSHDRGIISVDCICAAFENQEANHTEIMTIDGFWYEVVDGIEKVLDSIQGNECNRSVSTQVRRIKSASPAVTEKSERVNHEEARTERKKEFAYPKQGYGRVRYEKNIMPRDSSKDLPSRDGKGQYDTKSEEAEPTFDEGL